MQEFKCLMSYLPYDMTVAILFNSEWKQDAAQLMALFREGRGVKNWIKILS